MRKTVPHLAETTIGAGDIEPLTWAVIAIVLALVAGAIALTFLAIIDHRAHGRRMAAWHRRGQATRTAVKRIPVTATEMDTGKLLRPHRQ